MDVCLFCPTFTNTCCAMSGAVAGYVAEHVMSLYWFLSPLSDRLASHAWSSQHFHPHSNCTVRKSILVKGGTGFHILTSSFALPREIQFMASLIGHFRGHAKCMSVNRGEWCAGKCCPGMQCWRLVRDKSLEVRMNHSISCLIVLMYLADRFS